ncbi:MAG: hypothetical protein UW81_C0017G0015 [Candidatus Giovannonibacteria bacterium GW2011_GWC2_44_9]|uniref:Uncharacterized protein n=3 Tax=Candidatus Giovannoniibacteriota TaxID=1752738 RepID=A0A0G1ISJ1_9BACT|nr:MAG: hypothetical protein UW49_C0014G0026 [Candidatus Giovannonibacteria bacterium GW2011_GWB1_44_23]KKT62381.1 MAG: hypothetical protein UW57_C0017G0004 [Candidatus Giovannonibacteria bacterium GW2011_GWA1_44_29]KKT83491.1 MAG: hypothetical protein UW81_C0017G0015 [Candidatus Giovannonibacteria bacterium GW2011_GWC2_44_9]KKT90949.1 MAG: hypothetical protein UW93_C0016G0006 [Parcubacteria group bacterium GW2011_GWC1_45_13]
MYYKTVLLRKNGRIEVFCSPRMPAVRYKRTHVEIRGANKARKSFVLLVSTHDSAKIELTN